MERVGDRATVTTTVPSKNDLDKVLARLTAIEGRLDVIEKGNVEPPITEPPAEPIPVVTSPGVFTRSRTGAAPQPNRTPADLAAAKLTLPYSPSVPMKAPTFPTYTYGGTFDSVGLTKYMGQTGERQDIGLVTEAEADWLMGGSPNNMLQQAEAAGSVPVHALIDGRIIDVLKYPQATFFYRAAETGWKPYFDITQESVKPDTAHYPALSYVPYLATGDQRHLEDLQFAATFHICGLDPTYAQGKGILWPWQQRQFAWGLRDIIAAYIATPEGDVPAPLLPKSYWKTILDNNIAYHMARFVDGTDSNSPAGDDKALVQEMGFIAVDGSMRWVAPWQQDYISMVLGWAVWTGKVPQIRPLYDFQIRQAIKRATGPLRSCAIQYDFPNGAGKTWAETLEMNGRLPTADDHFPASVGGVPDYLGYLRGVLKVSVMNNVPGADDAFAYANDEYMRFGFGTKRWAVNG